VIGEESVKSIANTYSPPGGGISLLQELAGVPGVSCTILQKLEGQAQFPAILAHAKPNTYPIKGRVIRQCHARKGQVMENVVCVGGAGEIKNFSTKVLIPNSAPLAIKIFLVFAKRFLTL